MTSHELTPDSRYRPPVEPVGDTDRSGAGSRWFSRTRAREAAIVGTPALIMTVLGYRQRWVGDDGMIYARTVRQVLAGHGPVFNVGERAEASTGTLWSWLILITARLFGGDPSVVAVTLGILLTGGGYVLAMAAARKAVRPLSAAPLVPLGMVILLAVKADWDYATSGLENGLTTFWIALAWWLVVAVARSADGRGPDGTGADEVSPPATGGAAAGAPSPWARDARAAAGPARNAWTAHTAQKAGTAQGAGGPATAVAAHTAGGADGPGDGSALGQDVLAAGPVSRRPGALGYTAAFVVGLGPLVRPDLALVSAVFLLTLWWLLRPRPGTTLLMLAAACALPAAYEVFRAGYYGVLAPLPALTKEATQPVWWRGVCYLLNFVGPYRLWLPLVLLTTLAVLVPRLQRRMALRPELLAPPIAGLLSWLYVCRVGGDFMHGRLLLPGLLLLVLPLCAVPLTLPVGAATCMLAVWAASCVLLWRPDPSSGEPFLILDEQHAYAASAAGPYPISEAAHARVPRLLRPALEAAEAAGRPVLLLQLRGSSSPFVSLPLARRLGDRTAGSYAFLGYNGIVTPLDDVSVDPLGLAYPLAAHQARSSSSTEGRSGHEKPLDPAWIVADYTDPGTPLPAGLDPAAVRAARHALTCGRLAELQASVRAPLTAGRFLSNLGGAWTRTAFRYPADPVKAERALCRP